MNWKRQPRSPQILAFERNLGVTQENYQFQVFIFLDKTLFNNFSGFNSSWHGSRSLKMINKLVQTPVWLR